MNSIVSVINPISNYSSDSHISRYIALSSVNEFIPLHSCSNAEVLSKTNEKRMIYTLDVPYLGQASGTSKVSEFCANLFSMSENSVVPNQYWLRLHNANFQHTPGMEYMSLNGMLLEQGSNHHAENHTINPLMFIAIKKGFLFNFDKTNIDLSKLCLVVSRQLVDDEAHNRLYRNVKRSYIDVVEKELDVVYTPNLMRLCYNTGQVNAPKVKTLPDLLKHSQHISEIVSKDLLPNSNF